MEAAWYGKGGGADMNRFAHSLLPESVKFVSVYVCVWVFPTMFVVSGREQKEFGPISQTHSYVTVSVPPSLDHSCFAFNNCIGACAAAHGSTRLLAAYEGKPVERRVNEKLIKVNLWRHDLSGESSRLITFPNVVLFRHFVSISLENETLDERQEEEKARSLKEVSRFVWMSGERNRLVGWRILVVDEPLGKAWVAARRMGGGACCCGPIVELCRVETLIQFLVLLIIIF
eukprot:gene11214-7786_t